jgi:hypothetical protein
MIAKDVLEYLLRGLGRVRAGFSLTTRSRDFTGPDFKLRDYPRFFVLDLGTKREQIDPIHRGVCPTAVEMVVDKSAAGPIGGPIGLGSPDESW